ncbi:MAG: hypothetical protein H7281_11760 [Bacteriovorax sp.]|nr:hypothetical protein [Bacteriovorax sp.]
MQIVFFSRDKDLLEPIAPLSEEKHIIWHGPNLPTFSATPLSEGIVFFDFDDQEFNMEGFKAFLEENSILKKHFLKVLISSDLTVKAFKKLQVDNNFIDGFLRAPIKLKDIETFVEDYKLVLNEMREVMGEPKKREFEDPINAKIQRKFDLIFIQPKGKSGKSKESTVFNQGSDDFQLDGNSSMSNSSQKKPAVEKSAPKIDFDFDGDGSDMEFESTSSSSKATVSPPKLPAPPVSSAKTESPAKKLAVVPDDNDLEFTLDFGDDTPEIPAHPEVAHTEAASSEKKATLDIPAFDFSDSDNELDAMFDASIEQSKNEIPDGTQKTILFDKSNLSEIESFDLESTDSINSSSDLMSTEEAKANIESTIKDILRPKNFDSTQELDLSGMERAEDFSDFSLDAEESNPKISGTPSLGFSLKNNALKSSDTGEFDLSSVDFSEKETPEEVVEEKVQATQTQVVPQAQVYEVQEDRSLNSFSSSSAPSGHSSYVSDEESTRVQATIRQMREEREELLNQVKSFKSNIRELEQDNLTLKAALDESKIEVSILRKRHMVELEDIKYRLSFNEEKKAMAEEKARQAVGQKEKLEQRVRIDFNQVKLREKELETKLEMLSIDVDSQVQSRDQKILELRRKIDSLEFNMENVSIKEQKSQDDKRKLEDKLNKIMKTLRHSIKNLEDDIDQATDGGQDSRQGADNRSGKT